MTRLERALKEVFGREEVCFRQVVAENPFLEEAWRNERVVDSLEGSAVRLMYALATLKEGQSIVSTIQAAMFATWSIGAVLGVRLGELKKEERVVQ